MSNSNSNTMPNELKIIRKTGSLVVKLNNGTKLDTNQMSLPEEKKKNIKEHHHQNPNPIEKKVYKKKEYIHKEQNQQGDKITIANEIKYKQRDDNKYKSITNNNRHYSKSRSRSRRKSYSRSSSKSRRERTRTKHRSRSRSHERKDYDKNKFRSRQKSYSKDYEKKSKITIHSSYHDLKEDKNKHSKVMSHLRNKSSSRSRSRSNHYYSNHNHRNVKKYPIDREEKLNKKTSYNQSLSYSKEDSYQKRNSNLIHQISDFIPAHHDNNNNNKRGSYHHNNYNNNNHQNYNQFKQQGYNTITNNNHTNDNTQYQYTLQYQTMNQGQNSFNPSTAKMYQPQQLSQIPQVNPVPLEKKEKEPSNTVLVSDLGPDITKEILEDIFREKCLEYQTSMPEEIHLIEGLHCAYIIFPSIQVCMIIVEALQGYIYINGNYYQMIYTPNIQQSTNKESVTYITHLSDSSAYTTSMETTVHEDWFCEYCDCKNFSRRLQCFRCKRNKTINCRIAPVIKQKTTIMGEGGEIPPSSSLMIRGNILKESDDAELLEAFSLYGQVKDIRMAKDKLSNQLRDYAFIEYFSIEDATHALDEMRKCPLKIRGCQIFAAYSKIKREENIQPQVFSSYVINTSNLTVEEQDKLNKINHLQSLCQSSKTNPVEYEEVIKKNNNTTLKDKNIRRELTQKEKVENEMKKWVKKMEKNKSNEIAPIVSQKNIVNETTPMANNVSALDQEQNINDENEEENYDTVITFGVKTKELNPKEKDVNKENPIIIPDTSVICVICQRKFPSKEKLQMHESMSELHKKNLEKLSQNNNMQ